MILYFSFVIVEINLNQFLKLFQSPAKRSKYHLNLNRAFCSLNLYTNSTHVYFVPFVIFMFCSEFVHFVTIPTSANRISFVYISERNLIMFSYWHTAGNCFSILCIIGVSHGAPQKKGFSSLYFFSNSFSDKLISSSSFSKGSQLNIFEK